MSRHHRRRRERSRDRAHDRVGDKRDYFWRHFPVEKRRDLQIDEEALYSVSKYEFALQQAKVLRRFVQIAKDSDVRSSVTDGSACVGGDTLALAAVFRNVTAVELNEARFEMLRSNVRVALDECDARHVTCLCGDFNELVSTRDELDTLCLYLDAPWGGVDYRSKDRMVLRLGELHLGDCVMRAKEARPGLQAVGLKLPNNVDLEDLQQRLSDCRGCQMRIGKWTFVVLDFVRCEKSFRRKIDEIKDRYALEVRQLDQIKDRRGSKSDEQQPQTQADSESKTESNEQPDGVSEDARTQAETASDHE
ncbi:MAG: hypothetical protein MHM6MM_007713 [Cercozoa sp. M6MM]